MSENQETKVPQVVVVDNGPLAHFLDTGKFNQLQRVAQMFAQTDMVPKHYRGNVANCAIAIEMASRMDLAPMMFMQNTYIVHGRPGIEAKLAIALINSSGLFQGNLDYERPGCKPNDPAYCVRAFAIRKDTGEVVYGPMVDWDMVKAEGWHTKDGSKWKSMPAVMFDYRAAMFFARTICPERLMGMQTVEELQEIHEIKDVTPPSTAAQVELKNPVSDVTGNTVQHTHTNLGMGPAETAETTPPAVKSQPDTSQVSAAEDHRTALKKRLTELGVTFSNSARTTTLEKLLESATVQHQEQQTTEAEVETDDTETTTETQDTAAPVETETADQQELQEQKTEHDQQLDEKSAQMNEITMLLHEYTGGDQPSMCVNFQKICEAEFGEKGITIDELPKISPDAMPLVLEAVKKFVAEYSK